MRDLFGIGMGSAGGPYECDELEAMELMFCSISVVRKRSLSS